MRLADRPILLDGATKSFWLDKSSGKKCWMIAARVLTIIWGDTPRYWTWTFVPESRFPEVAVLLEVWWLEIHGRIKTSMLSPGTHYAAYLVFRTEDAYGLDIVMEASVGTAGGISETQTRPVYLVAESAQRGLEWQELKIGEFFTHLEVEDEVVLSVTELKDLHRKRGLIVEGIEEEAREIGFKMLA